MLPAPEDVKTVLSRSALLGGLGARDLSLIASKAEHLSVAENQIVFHHGDEGDALYILVSGALEVSVISVEGKKLSLNILQPGEVFGEISALDGLPRTATIVAMRGSHLLRVPGSSINRLLADNPQFAKNLIVVLCSRVRWINQQVEDFFLLNTESRLANRLLLLHKKFSDDDGILHLSQSELSEFLGTTRETVNKTMQSWRSRNLIELGRGHTRIVRLDVLSAIANPA